MFDIRNARLVYTVNYIHFTLLSVQAIQFKRRLVLFTNTIQLMTFDEVNTRVDQPMEHDIHRCIRVEYHVPLVDQSLYSPKLKVINCFII
jgi:hypothetical protein